MTHLEDSPKIPRGRERRKEVGGGGREREGRIDDQERGGKEREREMAAQNSHVLK